MDLVKKNLKTLEIRQGVDVNQIFVSVGHYDYLQLRNFDTFLFFFGG